MYRYRLMLESEFRAGFVSPAGTVEPVRLRVARACAPSGVCPVCSNVCSPRCVSPFTLLWETWPDVHLRADCLVVRAVPTSVLTATTTCLLRPGLPSCEGSSQRPRARACRHTHSSFSAGRARAFAAKRTQNTNYYEYQGSVLQRTQEKALAGHGLGTPWQLRPSADAFMLVCACFSTFETQACER